MKFQDAIQNSTVYDKQVVEGQTIKLWKLVMPIIQTSICDRLSKVIDADDVEVRLQLIDAEGNPLEAAKIIIVLNGLNNDTFAVEFSIKGGVITVDKIGNVGSTSELFRPAGVLIASIESIKKTLKFYLVKRRTWNVFR